MCWSQVIKGEGGQDFTRTFHYLGLLHEGSVCCPIEHCVGCHNAISVSRSWLSPGQGDASWGNMFSSDGLRWATWGYIRQIGRSPVWDQCAPNMVILVRSPWSWSVHVQWMKVVSNAVHHIKWHHMLQYRTHRSDLYEKSTMETCLEPGTTCWKHKEATEFYSFN